MVDKFHKFELPVSSFRVRHVLKRTRQLLYGNILLRHRVVCGTYNTLGAGADGFEVLVALEDGEACVADLNGIKVWVARRGRHGGDGSRVGHRPPLLLFNRATEVVRVHIFSCAGYCRSVAACIKISVLVLHGRLMLLRHKRR